MLWIRASALRSGGWSIKFVAPDAQRLCDTSRSIRRELAAAYPRLAADARKL